ncbi:MULTISPECIES: lipoprotein [Variovorax]|uniref:LPS translocon maturation chaperone LptM n=1 Tax=unclassified Variovorax TaxID=663243 RepID=UPI001AC31E8E|nr:MULTISPECIES: lipoprotein [Variovorax]MBN8753938.1 lipoprotein [Variovorax sp.]UKI09918.1 lipoprotein [Variovorax paradoxus]
MLNVRQILVSTRVRAALMVCLAAATTGLAACGQKGALYLPTDPAAAQRATLPQLLTPGGSDSTSSTNTTPAPAAPASSATTNSTNDSTGTRK